MEIGFSKNTYLPRPAAPPPADDASPEYETNVAPDPMVLNNLATHNNTKVEVGDVEDDIDDILAAASMVVSEDAGFSATGNVGLFFGICALCYGYKSTLRKNKKMSRRYSNSARASM